MTDSTEQRDNRAMIVFLLIVCVIFGGASLPMSGNRTQDLGVWLMRLLYGLAGLAGAAGLSATLRGSRRWSRLAYLLIIAIPIGTLLAYYAHVLRIAYLGDFERRREAGRRTVEH
ncbi:MAG: hypothetical protein R3B84_03325 [Zavarzinella sp.]